MNKNLFKVGDEEKLIRSYRVKPMQAKALKLLSKKIAWESGIPVKEAELLSWILDEAISRVEYSNGSLEIQ